ncbi:MAG: ABC transporter permease [Clostridia bacterium]|nr:ABC transporter permease [Clostridia bacterium]
MDNKTVLKSKSGWFDLNLKELFRYKDLIALFVKRDFVSLYKQTILGPAWAIIQPLLTTVVYTLIFGNVANLAAPGVPTFIFYLSGNLIWTYFSTALTATANTFTNNSAILGKVYFPRLVMPISTVISNLISLGIQFGFMIGFMIYYWCSGTITATNLAVLMTPLVILQLMLLSLGFGIMISALTTKYRDLKMLITFGLQLWLYASPVAYDMYSMEIFAPGGALHTLYMLNPVTPIINVFRYAYLGIGSIDWMFYGISWVVTILVFFIGVVLFSRVEKTFMDTI